MDKKYFIRFALFIIYAWFGLLKVIDVSPANAMVISLLDKTLPFIAPHTFLILFGLFEVVIGILFLFPKLQKLAIALFALHMIAAFMPLILLPELAWQGFFIPTLEGQYIIKNIALIALVVNL